MAKIINLDGIDCCGKTTQIELLKKHFESVGKSVLLTKEIGSELHPVTSKMRDVVLNSNYKISGESLQILHAAQAKIHREEVINKYIESNEYDIVLCDRSPLSFYAYGNAIINDFDWLYLLYNVVSENKNLYGHTVYLDIDVEVACERMKKRKPEIFDNKGQDVIEAMGIEFQKKVKHNFDYVLGHIIDFFEEYDFTILDVNKSTIEETHKNIVQSIKY